MISGTEKNDNPKSPSLSKFLRSLQSPVSAGYFGLRNGQIIRRDTMERWKARLPSRKQVKAARKSKPIPEPPMSRRELGEMFGDKALPGSKRRKLKATHSGDSYREAVHQLRRSATSRYYLGPIPHNHFPASMADRLLAEWEIRWPRSERV